MSKIILSHIDNDNNFLNESELFNINLKDFKLDCRFLYMNKDFILNLVTFYEYNNKKNYCIFEFNNRENTIIFNTIRDLKEYIKKDYLISYKEYLDNFDLIKESEEILKEYKIRDNGIIKSHGKFFNCHYSAALAYFLESFSYSHDDTYIFDDNFYLTKFELDNFEKKLFSQRKKDFYLLENSQGFVNSSGECSLSYFQDCIKEYKEYEKNNSDY